MDIEWCNLTPVEMIIQENKHTVEVAFEDEVGNIVKHFVPIEVAQSLRIGVIVKVFFQTRYCNV